MLTRINTNIMAQNAQRNLNLNTSRLATSMERLSSGLRINRAADDPSGLVLSQTLSAQVSGLDVVQQNVSEGVNLVKTAEGALTEVNSLLQQMNDLALDGASNSNNTDDSRGSLQSQLASARQTIEKIASNTKYAGVNLLDGTVGNKVSNNDTVHVAKLSLANTLPAASGAQNIVVGQKAVKASYEGDVTYANATTVLADDMTMVVNGKTIGQFTTTDTVQDVVDAVNAKSSDTGVRASFTNGGGIDLQAIDYGSGNNFSVDTMKPGGASAAFSSATAATSAADGTAGVNGQATFNGHAFTSASGLTLRSGSDSIQLTEAGNALATYTGAVDFQANSASFQIGLTTAETANVSIGDMRAAALNIDTLDISTVGGAQTALTALSNAMKSVTTLRGQLGAFQSNELEAQGRSVAVARENLAASESSIRDTDFGAEMANYSTSNILVQSATSFLTQANSLPQNLLQLIRG